MPAYRYESANSKSGSPGVVDSFGEIYGTKRAPTDHFILFAHLDRLIVQLDPKLANLVEFMRVWTRWDGAHQSRARKTVPRPNKICG